MAAAAAAAARRLPSKAWSSPSSGGFRLPVPTGARADEVGARYRLQQRRPVFTEAENEAVARVRELNAELSKVMSVFPSSTAKDSALQTEVMKMRWELKYKYSAWAAITFFGGMILTINSVLPHQLAGLDRDIQDVKAKLTQAQQEIAELKKVQTALPPAPVPTPIPATATAMPPEGGEKH